MVDHDEGKQSPENKPENLDSNASGRRDGTSTEKKKTAAKPVPSTQSPYPAHNDPELYNLIAGSQLVFYTRTSILNSNTASSITYVNFCRNGNFRVNSDGSFMVEGDYGGSAQGATYGQYFFTWQLVLYENQPAMFFAYGDGTTGVRIIDKTKVKQGRWRIGNTQYALLKNKVNCR